MSKPVYEVIAGGLGSGKSSHALNTFYGDQPVILGAGNRWFELINLRFGSIKKHRDEVEQLGLICKQTWLWTIVSDIENITAPVLIIDEWTSFRIYTLLWSNKKIRERIQEIFRAIDENPNLIKVVFVCSTCVPYLPFSLYKKIALWNKTLFQKADKVTRLDFGIPSVIKQTPECVGGGD
ncbi:MAG: hypothetical protein A2655_02605 [Candidatus Yanofskybacteria bacterium RIFCSPHIGHO2_01_FULL_43_42]|uniref:Adenosylcobinamide kinase n=1 Tax=Candidatus Yanofskybacteria bacterium RIFCSPLOWO2_01_FULL_43_22 TaxID=1802695 RepID=A0A1F8GGC0_9BACT|nr:MAG: hypothetical protein A2655_02605 [Candidatus Yanofskybacteria bacterium RIFCSPHIGHO2_01_FULL_43_42]OGN12441.1 MAG: hypothetical protein A3D48_00525 [Candidatus Yanofskybacteria bacterium RIFCSPHIGHO2_02_FULL_43_17]OGN24434.1 MAG: hypothetical protein A3A13_03435 [Candidatus Yanofskybacteria bacterium RIFCSPLOWO2_01_FULL_43_22]